MPKNIDLSIVIPLFNEQEVIPFLIEELNRTGLTLGKNYEVILVDDGSTDNTFQLIKKVADQNPKFKVIKFSRNFGHQAAFNVGIDFSQGDMVLTMDGDLQHPPALIPTFIRYAEEGHDIVIGERLDNKQNSKLREAGGRGFYKLMSIITNLEFRNVSDFALYKRPVVNALKKLPERERYLRGMIQWIGFKKKYVPYIVESRRAGKPKYDIKRLTKLVLSGVTSFSAFPLRLAFWAGLFVLGISIIFSGYVVVDHYVNPNPLIAGWATLVILVLFLGSIQLMVLGVVGEYMYKMFNEVKGRPLYIVSETCNIKNDSITETPYGIHSL
ncbi:MAG: glycosyltransferase family 2 protein [Candidatus Yanofskybacteria bacterium]|nr:glycosyltransferase family 2 protein [Candidatus Yanofskybacteria bacterium]